jgi:hypothetical protein
MILAALAKLIIFLLGHSERSEESNVLNRLRSFTSFRMTKTAILQEPRWYPNNLFESICL